MARLCRPPERHRSEGSLIAQGDQTRMSGRAFSLVTFSLRVQRESNSPGKGETFPVRRLRKQPGAKTHRQNNKTSSGCAAKKRQTQAGLKGPSALHPLLIKPRHLRCLPGELRLALLEEGADAFLPVPDAGVEHRQRID